MNRALLGIALAAAAVLYFGGLGAFPLTEPDEGRYTEIAREMLESGDFVTPRLNGVLYFEKPPLCYWLNAASQASFGRTEFASRFPSALLGFLGLGLAFSLGASLGGRGLGARSALVLATSPLYFAIAHITTLDMVLCFFVTGCLTCFWLVHRGDSGRLSQKLLWWGVFAGAALAVLTKGLVGAVIPAAVIGLYVAVTWQWAVLGRVPWVTGTFVFLAIAVPWHALIAARNPDFLWFYFVREHLLRYSTDVSNREQPFWYFGAVLLIGFLPWWGLLPEGLGLFRRSRWKELLRARPDLVFLWIWTGFVFFFFSASSSKLIPYVLPCIPPLAVLCGLALPDAGERDSARRRFAGAGLAAGSLLALATAGVFCAASMGWVEQYAAGGGVSPLPLALSASAVLGAGLALFGSLRREPPKAFLALAFSAACLCGWMWASAGVVTETRSFRDLAAIVAEKVPPGALLYSYRTYPQALPVYLGRTIGVVQFQGELEFGISRLAPEERARRFPVVAEFKPIWGSGAPVYVLAWERHTRRMVREGMRPGRILAQEGETVLLVNR